MGQARERLAVCLERPIVRIIFWVSNRRGIAMSSIDPLKLLNDARAAVPAVNYALGVAGIAAAAAIIVGLTGNSKAGIIIITLVFVGMILLYIFSSLATAGSYRIAAAGAVLIWAILIFFIVFLAFTVSAFAFGTPCNWAQFLGLNSSCGSGFVTMQVDGNEVTVSSGGPNASNPGCQETRATSCVKPQHGGVLVDGSGTVVKTKSYGRTGSEKVSSTPDKYCEELWANTTACETRHYLIGHVSAVEKFMPQ